MHASVQTALKRIEELGGISDHPEYLSRSFLSPASLRAAARVTEWMADAGLRCDHAADGTIRGRWECGSPGAAPLLLGSHLDTVVDAGKYDGALGVVAALAAVEILMAEGLHPPCPVHVLGFSDEEGVRFHTTYLGSQSVVGPLDASTLSAMDRSGRSLDEAIRREGWHHGATAIRYENGSVRGYVELHIEQGRVLEELDLPVCAVSAIAGQTRLMVTLTGRADHAGTTPMHLRRDALAGAAECILAAESLASAHPPLVITVGETSVHPGVSNSVPRSVEFSVDLRHPEDAERTARLEALRESVLAISRKRGLTCDWRVVQDNAAVVCDPGLTDALLGALAGTSERRVMLASGAGHDGVALSRIGPVAMVFVRCRDGLSHHPDEYASPGDIAAGIEVLVRFLKSLSA